MKWKGNKKSVSFLNFVEVFANPNPKSNLIFLAVFFLGVALSFSIITED